MTTAVDRVTSCDRCTACGRTASRPILERRVVSILFADIVGFTSLVDRLTPEQVWALQRDYFGTVSRVIRVEGGVVEKYVGDAVLAIFGSAAVDGHEAYRAVQAGLRLQERLDGHRLAGLHTVRTRVGIATGEALVDVTASDGGQAMASGAVVTTAARLQAYAPHGTVVVCPYTRHATASVVAYQDLPPVAVPGKPRPLDLWRALPRLPERPGRAGRRRPVRG